MTSAVDRRTFLATTAGAAAAAGFVFGRGLSAQQQRQPGPRRAPAPGDDHRGPCAISSANGLRATERAMALIKEGADPADAVVAGVSIIEDDPDDMTVGYGGLPNEDGVVQLDASVMHGPTHKAGAVAAIEGIRNPASVALIVLKRTDHVLIVGEGAQRFAVRHGFTVENLLTDRAREAWLRWKENLSPEDDWLDEDQRDFDVNSSGEASRSRAPFTYGTINCSAVNENGDLASVTTTSGLSYKIPGRVGDSPLVGAGMYVDNNIGAAGATGRGEAVIQNCGSFAIVQEMDRGATPTQACLNVLKRIADNTREKRLRDSQGRPNFNVVLYALRKDGAFGAAAMWKGRSFAVNDGQRNHSIDASYLYE